MNYLITGSTGLIGSHVLFELLYKKLTHPEKGYIYLLVRATTSLNAYERIAELLTSEDQPDYLQAFSLVEKLSLVRVIEGSFTDNDLPEKLSSINHSSTIVIHSGASTNLFQDNNAEQDVKRNNYLGTLYLSKAMVNCYQFVFISTAFCFGLQEGVIKDSYQEVAEHAFRNAYEKYKNKVEGELISFFGKRLKIVRPSIVCGRLLDTPKYVTSKFDVVYGWGKFFYKLKNRVNEHGVRLHVKEGNQMNIIPVDYFVKVLFNFIESPKYQSLNVVNHQPEYSNEVFESILSFLGIFKWKITSGEPEVYNSVEKAFYKTVNVAFGPYLTRQNVVYNTDRLKEFDKNLNYSSVLNEIPAFFQFAVERGFIEGYKNSIIKELVV